MSDNPYIRATDSRYRSIDIARFAADLAREIGGIARPWNADYPNENQAIDLTDATTLHLRADDWKGRVAISIDATDIPFNDRPMHGSGHQTESVTVNPDGRPIAAIARDVTKRVIEANADAIAKRRAYAIGRRDDRANLAAMVAALAGGPIRARINDDGLSADVGIAGHYIYASLSPSGAVSINRIENISLEKFTRIAAIIAETAP